ncbi:ABC-2 type transport system ATP-binding protein [Tistlia consotensis]|uniref:ABC-2 type transport system ATP-binding protein n=1 Tax=Tistlia consotensis USBA 355 TaxID=560819 RepID=A0A1Y6BT82_9PROT|nr:ATP-binding cassette domain-containing protein [Tistlia consotensis]SMF27741.1 ABC-2 type transport system ATP-binding protein [Tistlia consotensis USBA 355]SNR65685.1 ABC-2 type transport system ATP-binding protein [Tistlia consotensis]
MAGGDEYVIQAEAAGRRFGDSWAVREVDLRVGPGEIVGFVGPDGAGKTTLLQMLAAILDPSAGRCRVLGFDTVRQASKITARIGYMPQGFTLYERLTVVENLAFAARVRAVPASQFPERRRRLLEMAGLLPFLDRAEGALSGGMRKKLALCTNLVHEPPLLLLDEPGLGVDPLSRRELWRMLEDFRRSGATIVFATSYMDEAERCDRLAFLDRGRIVAQGTPGELCARAEGAIFRLQPAMPAGVEDALTDAPEVLGVQWRPTEVRVAVDPRAGLSQSLRRRLERLGPVEASPPSMEDVFVVLRQADDVEAPTLVSEPAGSSRLAPRHRPAVGIETRSLTRRFGGFLAVDDVSLRVNAGEIFALLGANGAGKTTLIRLLCGLLPASSGSARVADVEVGPGAGRLRRRIGYMSQRFSLYPDLTVGENLDFFASAYELPRREARDAIAWAVATTGLAGTERRIVARLSGAQRQRLALACSLLHRPAVLFLDEPTSGVDPLARFRFWRLVGRLSASGTTVVVTTHYLEEAAYCHRLGLMHEGRLIAAGDLPSLRAALPGRPPATVEELFLAYIERARTGVGAAAGGQR